MTSREAPGGDPTRLLVLERQDVVRIAFVAVTAGLTWWAAGESRRTTVIFVGLSGLLVGGWPIFKEAAENLAVGQMTMELSMSLAIVAAAAIQEFVTALVITLFVLVAEVLENTTRLTGAARDSLSPRRSSTRGNRSHYGRHARSFSRGASCR